MRVGMLYTTVADMTEAKALADAVLARQLAACVNVVPGMRSFYRWQGELRDDGEVIVLMKTDRARKKALCDLVKGEHPYETPALLWFDAQDSDPDFAAWITAMTSPGSVEAG